MDLKRTFVIVLGCCLAAPAAALAQTTQLNRPGSPYIFGVPFSPFAGPQYNVPGPQAPSRKMGVERVAVLDP
jgi:hypothetical protein